LLLDLLHPPPPKGTKDHSIYSTAMVGDVNVFDGKGLSTFPHGL